MLNILSPSRFVHKGITHSHNQAIRETISYFSKFKRENHRFSLTSQKYSHIASESKHFKQNVCVW